MRLSGDLVARLLNEETLDLAIEALEAALGRERADTWLHSPNSHLEGKTPQSLIDNGLEKIVINLVSDMVTGSPL